MICPFCGSDQVIVFNSRSTIKNTQVWRRRRCLKCSGTYSTKERSDISHIVVVKKDGRRVRYSHPKLYSSIYHAAINRKRTDRGEAGLIAETILIKVETYLINNKVREVTTTDLQTIVFKVLVHSYPDIALGYLAYFNPHQTMPDYLKIIKRLIRSNT